MTLNKGDILGQRYEIAGKIGVGGMSGVYLAKDTRLGRDVAVKVLKEELAAEDDIKARFGDEAKSAASLVHSNIVNVYDVGEDKGLNFIIMEYINGKTLKELIKAKAPFDSITTISISIQIASALSYAHKNKIIHRDIKPQNIMISSNGNVKVMDFGIARAANISTLTNVVSAVGSVHYFSPEQARGGFIDNKSDIYSLGITMYEMVTGKIPFSGENSVSIALKHINDDLPDMREYNPSLNRSLEGIIKKAANKRADERYASIDLMLDDLRMALSEVSEEFIARKNGRAKDIEDAQERVVQSNPDKFYNIDMSEKDKEIPYSGNRDVRVWFDADNTAENTMREAKADMEEKMAAEESEYKSQNKEYNLPASTVGFDMYSKKFNIEAEDPEKSSVRKHFRKVEDDYDDYDDDDDFDEGYTKKEERKVIATAIITAIIIVAVVIFIGVKFFVGSDSQFKLPFPNPFASAEAVEEEELSEVPVLIGLNYEEAYETYRGKGFAIVKAGTDNSDSFAEGVIISQDVSEGTEITEGLVVNVIVSKGSADFIMPAVIGVTESEAETNILYAAENAGADNITINAEYEFSSEIGMGIVMGQSFAENATVTNGSTILLTVSKGEEFAVVAVPDVEGKTLQEAEKAMLERGLIVGSITTIKSDVYEEGYVITQTLKAGEEVAKNSTVDLIVSEGSENAEETPGSQNGENSGQRNAVIYTIDKPANVSDDEMVKIKLFKVDVSGTTTTLIETQRLGSEFPFDVQLVGEGQAEIQLYINDEYQWSKNVSF